MASAIDKQPSKPVLCHHRAATDTSFFLMPTVYNVNVEWDDDAQFWVASSDDVPGLATGADTIEALIEKLKVIIPELLEENGMLPSGVNDVPFAIRAERTEHAQRAA
jgi:predicted RNase H-like HicB family nuclease